jgi:hypothetical protein
MMGKAEFFCVCPNRAELWQNEEFFRFLFPDVARRKVLYLKDNYRLLESWLVIS